jgi:hypothetical protein
MAVVACPEWYTTASKNLATIEDHAADYEDPEEGDKAPTADVFEAVRRFLIQLRNVAGSDKLDEPKIFVSPNGHLILTYSHPTSPTRLDIRFTPRVHYHLQLQDTNITGSGNAEAVELTHQRFRI